MDRVENKVAGLGRKVHTTKNCAEESFTKGHPRECETQGGINDEVLRTIQDEEASSTDASDEEGDGRLTQAKSLDEFFDNADPPEIKKRYGKLPLVQSSHQEYGQWTCLPELSSKCIGDAVTFRGRVHVVRRMSPELLFIIFREQLTTVQGVLRFREGEISKAMIRWVGHIRSGSIVVAKGTLQKAEQDVTGTTFHDVDILLNGLNLVTERVFSIPFSVYEAEAATDGHAIADRVRLSNRILDLRSPTSQAIFRLQSGMCNLFRIFLSQRGFLEIHTPKMQGGATEGGSAVFGIDYFGRPAFLAQSPQLAKQMCISADFGRVFEIGPVFRAG
jgi:lysyl-tRNA synthetase class II